MSLDESALQDDGGLKIWLGESKFSSRREAARQNSSSDGRLGERLTELEKKSITKTLSFIQPEDRFLLPVFLKYRSLLTGVSRSETFESLVIKISLKWPQIGVTLYLTDPWLERASLVLFFLQSKTLLLLVCFHLVPGIWLLMQNFRVKNARISSVLSRKTWVVCDLDVLQKSACRERETEVSVNRSRCVFNPLISRWPRHKNSAWMRSGL